MKIILQQPAFYIGLILNIFVAGLAAADPLSFLYHGWQVDLTLARGEVPDAQKTCWLHRNGPLAVRPRSCG